LPSVFSTEHSAQKGTALDHGIPAKAKRFQWLEPRMVSLHGEPLFKIERLVRRSVFAKEEISELKAICDSESINWMTK
jgi:hypothetical protein